MDYICDDAPILHPPINPSILTNISSSKCHIIIHRQIYAKKKADMYFQRMKFRELYMTITMLSGLNGTELYKEEIVQGEDVESIMYQILGLKNTKWCIFDDTKPLSNFSSEYNYRRTLSQHHYQQQHSQESQLSISNTQEDHNSQLSISNTQEDHNSQLSISNTQEDQDSQLSISNRQGNQTNTENQENGKLQGKIQYKSM